MTKASTPLPSYTFEQVLAMVGGLARRSELLDEQFARSEAQYAAQRLEFAAQLARTDAQLAEYAAQSKIGHEKLRATLDETSREVKETTRVVQSVSRQLGSMSANLGDVAEEYFYNSLKADPKIGNIRFDSVSPNLRFGNKKQHNEFDIVLVNGKSVALIEVKHKAHVKDLEQVAVQAERYRYWQRAHKDFDIYCGLAAFSVPADVVDAAHEQGLFVLQRQGGVFQADAGSMRPL